MAISRIGGVSNDVDYTEGCWQCFIYLLAVTDGIPLQTKAFVDDQNLTLEGLTWQHYRHLIKMELGRTSEFGTISRCR